MLPPPQAREEDDELGVEALGGSDDDFEEVY